MKTLSKHALKSMSIFCCSFSVPEMKLLKPTSCNCCNHRHEQLHLMIIRIVLYRRLLSSEVNIQTDTQHSNTNILNRFSSWADPHPNTLLGYPTPTRYRCLHHVTSVIISWFLNSSFASTWWTVVSGGSFV